MMSHNTKSQLYTTKSDCVKHQQRPVCEPLIYDAHIIFTQQYTSTTDAHNCISCRSFSSISE
jgi:hypothetical protein